MIEKYISLQDEILDYKNYLENFINKELKEFYENTEIIVDLNILKKSLDRISEYGLINSNLNFGEEMDLAIWSKNQKNLNYSLIALFLLGKLNGGLAYLSHKISLAQFLLLSLNSKSVDEKFKKNEVWLETQGNYGLCRNILAKYLLDQELNEKEISSLQDYFFLQEEKIIQFLDFIKFLYIFSFENHQLFLNLYEVEIIEKLSSSHGLEELRTYKANLKKVNQISISKELYVDLLLREILGILSISGGRLFYALEKTFRYTKERTQGGNLIYHYPAIQNLLFNADSILQISLNSIFSLSYQENSLSLFSKVLRIKKILMPLIVSGISDCLQCFGGYGYMRDYGIEKAYRDANYLKQILGTNYEISIFLSELEKNLNLVVHYES